MKKNKKSKAVLIVAGVILAMILTVIIVIPRILFPSYEEPVVTGNLTVKTELFTWVDESRTESYADTGEKRALTVKFWYPEEEGEYPLVVFSHGAFGVIDSNHSTCMELASNGYVVASIGHPYHAMFVEDVNGNTTIVDMEFMQQVYADNGGEYTQESEKQKYELTQEWMELRVADENFVLDTVLNLAENGNEEPFTMVDTERIGLFGHSMGGASSVALGRIRDDIDAVIDLEGTMMGEYVGFENGYEIYNEEPYPIPVLEFNSQAVRDDIDALEKEHPEWEYVNDYLGRNAIDYREIVIQDAGHLNFTDLPMVSPFLASLLGVGEADAKACIEQINQEILHFFDYYLKGEAR